MKILITGSNGFIGKNLVAELKKESCNQIFECTRENFNEEIDFFCKECDVIFHLAGIQRPENNDEFMKGNYETTVLILEKLKKYNNRSPIILASSIQAELDNIYGISKKASENELINYNQETGVAVYIYRLTNIFGKWGKPNFNSAVTTFCYNVAHKLPLTVNDPSTEMRLIYIDDVIKEFLRAINGEVTSIDGFCYIEPIYRKSLGKIVNLLGDFKKNRDIEQKQLFEDEFSRKLYITYLSYVP